MWFLLFSCSSQWQKRKACLLATKQRDCFFPSLWLVPQCLVAKSWRRLITMLWEPRMNQEKALLHKDEFIIPFSWKAYNLYVKSSSSKDDDIKTSKMGKRDSRKKEGKKLSTGHWFAPRHSSDLLAFTSAVYTYLPRTRGSILLPHNRDLKEKLFKGGCLCIHTYNKTVYLKLCAQSCMVSKL